MNVLFTSEETVRRADELVDYLRGPRLWIPGGDYPDFDAWLERAHGELKDERKRALVAMTNAVVGAIVYQRHRGDPRSLELKNITVRPDERGRLIASFLLRNAEREGVRDYGSRRAVVDTKRRNYPMRQFLFRNGYRPVTVADLYGLSAGEDVVYEKLLDRSGA